MIDYIYIDRQDQLDEAMSQLAIIDFLSIDTESSSFYTYYSELCLIQVSSKHAHFIIDVLAPLDLSSLGNLLNGSSTLKIFHDALADMVELYRRYNWPIHNIFDTHLAAKYLNLDSYSLLGLVKKYIGIQLEKKEQKSNWLIRPLSKSQLNYAHQDTLYLHTIQEQMTSELKQANLYSEFESEMEWLTLNLDNIDAKDSKQENQESDSDTQWLKVKGASKLLAQERGRFRALYNLREDFAKQVNIASFRIFNNRTLFEIIAEMPKTRVELRNYGVHTSFLKQKEGELLELLHKSKPIYELPKLPIKNNRDQDPEVERRLHKLKDWRQKMIDKRKLESSLILSSKALKTIAKENPNSLNELEALQLMSKWKLAEYGPALLKVI